MYLRMKMFLNWVIPGISLAIFVRAVETTLLHLNGGRGHF